MRTVGALGGYSLQLWDRFEELPELEAEWRYLEAERGLAFNATYDLYRQVSRGLEGVTGPFVLLARRQGASEPAALLVGRISEERRPYSLGYQTVGSVPVRALTFIYGGAHLLAEDPELLALLGGYLGRQACREAGADLLSLYMLGAQHPLLAPLLQAGGGWSNRRHLPLNPHWALALPASLEEFYLGKSAKHRSNVRGALRRLQREFPDAQLRRYDGAQQMEELFAAAAAVSAGTYQRGLGAGFQDDPFTRGVFRLAADRGMLRSYVLFLGGRPAAFENGFLHGGRYHGHSVGYDPQFARYSVGTCLWLMVLEDLLKTGSVREWDFGFGDAEYKRDLCNQRWLEATPCIYDRSIRGARLKALDWLAWRISGLLRTAVRLGGAERRLRRAWRRRLTGPRAKQAAGSGSVT
jgi:CelD/BcsL family acetyltransferase involved in cellulose biosynthesis